MRNQSFRFYLLFIMVLICTVSCQNKGREEHTLSVTYDQLNDKAKELIREFLSKADTSLLRTEAVRAVYDQNNNGLAWSDSGHWNRTADSFLLQLSQCRQLGLFPEDYHYPVLRSIWDELIADSLQQKKRHDPSLWAHADLLFTDAWLNFVHDVKLGRLPGDSVSLNKDSLMDINAYKTAFQQSRNADSISSYISSLEPAEKGYHDLKLAIKNFLAKASFKPITKITAASKDKLEFKKAIQRRLYEEGLVEQDSLLLDSLALSQAIKKFQEKAGIAVDGNPGAGTVRMLNLDDREKFIRVAISMDKYKKLPAQMPGRYIWVNASSNFLRVMDDGKQRFSSRVVTGKPLTRTPMLTSAISALVTYPQWVPPQTIIQKEILPAVKKNPGYLQKKGFSLLDSKGEEVDPYSVDWTKYSKSIPYKVVQGSGDANALGIIKFYFDNKYAVYLHDTNQRYLFGSPMRNLSHGCVRVQQWQDLLNFVLLTDSLQSGRSRKDSVSNWLKNKEKRQIALRARIPVFIRYLTCEGQNGQLVFYDDVYGDDRMLRERYFTRK